MPTICESSCGCRQGPNVEQGKWYGVRSYLHLFYEDCTGASLEDDVHAPTASPASSGWASVLWKVTLSAGTLLLLTGALALATGYLLHPKLEGIGEAEFVVLDQQAVEYNHALGICRAVGIVLCAMAGALLVACVLSSGLCRINRDDKDTEEQLSPILQQSPPGQQGTIVTAAALVPFRALKVQSVQPKRDP
ncbi:neurensin-2 [Rhineura floridana]|uniref:neurensin-2 n=1 Tax=Rhineura floridana TaxID=261503 RepID=UPI002AC851C1|nr:neurensin-2 [Rhineura floridana]